MIRPAIVEDASHIAALWKHEIREATITSSPTENPDAVAFHLACGFTTLAVLP